MEPVERELIVYETAAGKFPFDEWLDAMRDRRGRNIVTTRLERLRSGNLGNCKMVGRGVLELKIDFGPGYRVYLAEDGPRVVLLLIGGDKSTQANDIPMAQRYWSDYKESHYA